MKSRISARPQDTHQGTSAEDENGHGTMVSGIITSGGQVSDLGVAPDVEIVAVRVLDTNNKGWKTEWIAGMDWVLTNLSTLKVQVINMSLGTWKLYPGSCDQEHPVMAAVIAKLREKGVLVFAATGNHGSTQGVAAPACNTGVIGVGATYDDLLGRYPPRGTHHTAKCHDPVTSPTLITCFTNCGTELDLLAPGGMITGPWMGGGKATHAGTSLAAPTAAGVAALLLGCDPTLAPEEVEMMLKQTGKPTTHPTTKQIFPLVRALDAVNACLCGTPGGAGTGCDDGRPCTYPDLCDGAGACVGQPYTCEPGPCHVTATCNGRGGCATVNRPDKIPCSDGDPCTSGETCAAGTCVGASKACPAADACHAEGRCDPQTGTCKNPELPDGTPCSRGVCKGGRCLSPDSGIPPADTGPAADPPRGCGCAVGAPRSTPFFWVAFLLLAAWRCRTICRRERTPR